MRAARRAVVGVVLVMVSLAVGGCMVQPPPPPPATQQTDTPTTASTSGAASTGSSGATEGFLRFATAPYRVPAGWQVSTGKPRAWHYTNTAAGGEGALRYVRVDVTLTNLTGQYQNAAQVWDTTLGIGGARTGAVYDTDVGGPDVQKAIPPGRTTTFGVVWPLAEPSPVTVQLGLDPRTDTSGQSHVLFQGEV